jgi:hypothetical protein
MAEGRTISRRKSPPSMREAKWFSPHLADDLLVLLPADLLRAQGQTAARGCDQLARRANQQKLSSPLIKIFRFTRDPNQRHNSAHLIHQRGVGHVTNAR